MKKLLILTALAGMFGNAAIAQDERLAPSKKDIPLMEENYNPEGGAVIIDGRPQAKFKESHLPGAINIQEAKFGEFLKKMVDPDTEFFVVADNPERLSHLVDHADSVGYGPSIKGVFVYNRMDGEKMQQFDKAEFDQNPEAFTVVDVRGEDEHEDNPVFEHSVNIPLPELAERAGEIPTDKPIVVHCGTGYRSAIGASILHHELEGEKIIDMGDQIKGYLVKKDD
ncbi:rhodanese-like domain-containing protein [Litoribacter populi]|uniref:rhodanese-like domain-containing protein n=1 Tax=Litoribacter populi TaxID=2598460 RepID=UPI00118081C7|nr:rhodanese-like domain-containing protein [Litoribacter populi]